LHFQLPFNEHAILLLADQRNLELFKLKNFTFSGPIFKAFFFKLVSFVLFFTTEHDDVVDVFMPYGSPKID